MADEKVLRALLRFGVDPRSVDEVRRGVKSVEDALKGVEDTGKEAFDGAEKSGSKFAAVLTGAVAGAVMSLTNSLVAMAQQGVSSFKQLLDSSVELNKQFETYRTQFETFLKSDILAEDIVKQLQAFNVATPFELPQLVEGAKMLQTFGGAALNTAENWKLVGDAAASVNRPFEQAAFWVGRLYSNLQAGRPFGEAAMALQEMGIMSGQMRTKLEDMSKAGADSTEIWDTFTTEMTDKFEGGAERLSKTLQGIESNLADFQSNLLLVGGEAYFEQVKEDSQQLLDTLSDPAMTAALEDLAITAGEFAAKLRDIATSGFLDSIENIDAESVATLAASMQDLSESITKLLDVSLTFDGNKFIDALTTMSDATTLVYNGIVKIKGALGPAGELLDRTKDQVIGVVNPFYKFANTLQTINESAEILAGTTLTDWLRGVTDATSETTEAQDAAREAEAERLKGLAALAEQQKQAAEAEAAKRAEEEAAAQQEAAAAAEAYAKALDKVNEANAKLDLDFGRKLADAEKDNQRKLEDIEKETGRKRLEAMLDFERDMADEEDRLAQERVDIAEENLRKIADIEREYAQDRADAQRDYQREVKDIERDLGRAQQDAQRDYRNKIIDIDRKLAQERVDVERDYQQQIAGIRADFEQSAEDAARANDAIGFLAAQRRRDNAMEDAQQERDNRLQEAAITAQREREQAAIDRQRAMEEAKIDAEREREDAQQQREQELEDLRAQFEQEMEEQRRATDEKIQQAIEESNAKKEAIKKGLSEEQAAITAGQREQITDLKTAYDRKLADLQTYHNRRISDTRQALQEELSLINQYTAEMQRAQSGGISSAGGANYSGYSSGYGAAYTAAFRGRRAAGGYATNGLYQLGENGKEFVTNAITTRALENALGGQLSQAALMSMAQRQQTVSFTQNNTFNERDDAKTIMSTIGQQIDDKLLRYTRGY